MGNKYEECAVDFGAPRLLEVAVSGVTETKVALVERVDSQVAGGAGYAATALKGAANVADKALVGVKIADAYQHGSTAQLKGTTAGVFAGEAAGYGAGAITGVAVGVAIYVAFAPVSVPATLFAGLVIGGTAFAAKIFVSDYVEDRVAKSVCEAAIDQLQSVVDPETRQSRITSTDSGMQARYDNPQYDAQTADGKGVTRAYVDAYARGDLKTAAQLLVDHGANIYPDAKNEFYADAIIRQMAGYAGGIAPTANQTLARNVRDAMGNDGNPNTYPDAIIRVVAAPKSHSNSSSNDNHTTVHSTKGVGYQGKSSDPPSGGKPSSSTGNSKVDTNHLAKVVEGKVRGGLPVVLDLNGSGIEITALGQSAQHIIGGDGLLHRTAWAGAGDGVLFIDADGDGTISNLAEYVFTEWDRTASDDMEAMRRVFDTDGDGKLTEADARWGEFRGMASNAEQRAAEITRRKRWVGTHPRALVRCRRWFALMGLIISSVLLVGGPSFGQYVIEESLDEQKENGNLSSTFYVMMCTPKESAFVNLFSEPSDSKKISRDFPITPYFSFLVESMIRNDKTQYLFGTLIDGKGRLSENMVFVRSNDWICGLQAQN